MNYALQQRLRLIDFLLANYGFAAPRHVADYYGVSKPQSSLDFAKYNELHPGNMQYVHATLRWISTTEFKRAYP